MTLANYSVTAFTVLNGARIVAYLPQIVCVHHDRAGASSVSMMTWAMFFRQCQVISPDGRSAAQPRPLVSEVW